MFHRNFNRMFIIAVAVATQLPILNGWRNTTKNAREKAFQIAVRDQYATRSVNSVRVLQQAVSLLLVLNGPFHGRPTF